MPDIYLSYARELIDTPFQPGQRCPGAGIDCIGVVVWPAAKRGLRHQDVRAYPALRPNGQLLRELNRQMVRVPKSAARPADILAMRFDNDEPHHLAIYAGGTLIHAYLAAHKCVEQEMVAYWWNLTYGVFRFKEFVDVR